MVREFDGAMSEAVEDIDIELEIGLHILNIPFQIMNIKLTYNILLERP